MSKEQKKCKCDNLENGDIINVDCEGKCVVCGRGATNVLHNDLKKFEEAIKSWCEVSGQYGKDNDKQIHFYCEHCDKEMEYDEVRKCPARTPHDTWEEKFDEKYIRTVYEEMPVEFHKGLVMYADNIKSFIRSLLSQERERIVEYIESKYGKFGSHSGSLGYKGLVMGMQSYQTPEDKMRDDIITRLSKENGAHTAN